MNLTYDQKKKLYDDGFVVVPGVIPPAMVDAAIKAINHSLGDKGIDPEQLIKFRSQSYCPEIQDSPAIAGLVNDTPALSLLESVVGAGSLLPMRAGQVALRFPGLADPPGVPRPHIDGMYSPNNGMKEGEIGTFTALIGVMLSDVLTDNAGNFTVWPGTHRLNEAYFREHTPQALLEGMPKIEMPTPVGVTGRAGDIVIAHYMLAHSASPNVSPHIRYACFFRAKHKENDEKKWEMMTDIWMHWPGIREVMG